MVSRRTAKGRIAAPRLKPTLSVTISQQRVPRLPHERDEAVESQPGKPRQVIKRAAADLKRGNKDTDRSAQMNRIYKKLKVSP